MFHLSAYNSWKFDQGFITSIEGEAAGLNCGSKIPLSPSNYSHQFVCEI